MALLLGLDIGTTSTIGIVIDTEGRTLGIESRPVTLQTPELNWAEEDPEEWWANVGDITRSLIATCGLAPDAIAGIGVTGMLPAIILLDERGAVLRRSIQQNDARAVDQLARFAAGMEESDFLGLTGTGYSQQLVGPKLMWLRQYEPEILLQRNMFSARPITSPIGSPGTSGSSTIGRSNRACGAFHGRLRPAPRRSFRH